MNQHRLVVDPKVIQHDYESAQTYPLESQLKYQLIYQMSRLTSQRGAITHDDRLDALSMAVAYWTTQMAQDADNRMQERKVDQLDDALRQFEASYKGKKAQTTTWI